MNEMTIYNKPFMISNQNIQNISAVYFRMISVLLYMSILPYPSSSYLLQPCLTVDIFRVNEMTDLTTHLNTTTFFLISKSKYSYPVKSHPLISHITNKLMFMHEKCRHKYSRIIAKNASEPFGNATETFQ